MRTAIYARVSTESQALIQTIEQQVARLTAHVNSQGEMLHTADIFRDDGYSGATLTRPKLRQHILSLCAKFSRPSLMTSVARADMPPRE
jgi:DNA invertase Pin-like site-specific DNA recombinase